MHKAANEPSSNLRQCGRVAGAWRKFGGHSPSPQRIAGEGLFFSHVSVRIAVQRTIIMTTLALSDTGYTLEG